MMKLGPEQEKKALAALAAVLALLIVYRVATSEKPKTAPLVYPRGSVARSLVREGLTAVSPGADSLNVILARRQEKFPGVSRDIFRMENPAPKPKPAPVIAPPPPPPPPPPTPEQIAAEKARLAAEAARADLSRFRFLGYLTSKDNTLFLSKDGETFIVRSGDKLLASYQVKEAGKDYVILLDTATRVEVRVELSGSEGAQPPQPQPGMPRFR
jgi:hypothetical protein